jgi:hypothetical protein
MPDNLQTTPPLAELVLAQSTGALSNETTNIEAVPQNAIEVWFDFFSNRKAAPQKFLKSIERGELPRFDDDSVPVLAARLQELKGVWGRLIQLLQNTSLRQAATERSVLKLAEALFRWKVFPPTDSPMSDELNLEEEIHVWLRDNPKRPLPKNDLEILHVGLLLGIKEASIRQDGVTEILRNAVGGKSSKTGMRNESGAYFPIDYLLKQPLTLKTTEHLLLTATWWCRQNQATLERFEASERQCRDALSQISRLTQELAAKDERLQLESERLAFAEATIRAAREEAIHTRDGFEHEITQIKAQIRGDLQGPMRRFTERCVQALNREPPNVEVLNQELENMLELLVQEEKWLNSLA